MFNFLTGASRRDVKIRKLVGKFSKLLTLYEVLYCTSSEYITVTLFKLCAGIEICRNLSRREPLCLIALWKFQISGKVSHAVYFITLFRIMPYLIIFSVGVSAGSHYFSSCVVKYGLFIKIV